MIIRRQLNAIVGLSQYTALVLPVYLCVCLFCLFTCLFVIKLSRFLAVFVIFSFPILFQVFTSIQVEFFTSMKCVVLLLMLFASVICANDSPQGGSYPVLPGPPEDEEGHFNLVLLLLRDIRGDVRVLNVKTDNLQDTTDDLQETVTSLQTAVCDLVVKTDNLETKVTGR